VRLADREGLDAVTLRRLASVLGVHVTSLYNHVPNHEAVIDGVVQHLLAEAKLPVADFTWEDWIRRFAAALLEMARAHPGAVNAFQRRPIQGADAAASFEAAIGVFRDAGFGLEDAYNAVQAAAKSMLAFATEEAVRLREPSPPRTDLSVLPQDRFPNIHAVGDFLEEPETWSFLIDTLIAGLRTRLRSTAASG